MNTREYFLGRKFSDPTNYPYGIEKSGDFSIKEIRLLHSMGGLYKALVDAQVSNPNAEDQHLLEVVSGVMEAQTDVEKVYRKYWQKTHPEGYVPSMIITGGATDFVGDAYAFSD